MSSLPIIKPPFKKLGKYLESRCRKALYQHEMLSSVDKLGIALSGGKDSLTLLFLLKAISGRGFPPFELTAFHVSGTFSCGASISEKWLENICNELGVPFVSLKQEDDEPPKDCYLCSRKRRKLLFQAATERAIHTIAFGHHQDDNAQTLLLNLLYKGEFAGLLPKIKMHRYNITLIRPLIFIEEEKIREFAKENGFLRFTCQCEKGALSMRKKVDQLMTHWEEDFPFIRSNLSSAALRWGSDKAKFID